MLQLNAVTTYLTFIFLLIFLGVNGFDFEIEDMVDFRLDADPSMLNKPREKLSGFYNSKTSETSGGTNFDNHKGLVSQYRSKSNIKSLNSGVSSFQEMNNKANSVPPRPLQQNTFPFDNHDFNFFMHSNFN